MRHQRDCDLAIGIIGCNDERPGSYDPGTIEDVRVDSGVSLDDEMAQFRGECGLDSVSVDNQHALASAFQLRCNEAADRAEADEDDVVRNLLEEALHGS